MNTVSIIKYQGTNFETVFDEVFSTEKEALDAAKKFIDMESLKRFIPLLVNPQPKNRVNSSLKIYNVLDNSPCHPSSILGKGTLMYNILINDPKDQQRFNLKRAHAGAHAGF